jgi:7-carboxy-7-deazaguanine synthase
MRINEIFYSLQGEGFLAGIPSVFVRLAGCPLRCKWCDTKYAWDETEAAHYSIDKIVKMVDNWPCRFVVITGGEPMINPDFTIKQELPELVHRLKNSGKHITIETAGISFVPDLPCDLMSISPKLSNSTPAEPKLAAIHEDSRLDIAVLAELIDNYQYQLKFVVDSQADLPEIQQTIEEIGNVDLEKVMLMPQARTRDEFLAKSTMVADMCKRTGFIFCQRLQVLLWNSKRGT